MKVGSVFERRRRRRLRAEKEIELSEDRKEKKKWRNFSEEIGAKSTVRESTRRFEKERLIETKDFISLSAV